MKLLEKSPYVMAVLLLPEITNAAPPATRVHTVAGAEKQRRPGPGLDNYEIPLPNDELYGMRQSTAPTLLFDYMMQDEEGTVATRWMRARVCRLSYKGTLVCGADSVDIGPPVDTVRTMSLSTEGVGDGASPWDSYFVEYEPRYDNPSGVVEEAQHRVLGVGIRYDSEGAASLPASNWFTIPMAKGAQTEVVHARQVHRVALPNDQVYGFAGASSVPVWLDFRNGTHVRRFTAGEPSVEVPIDYSLYDIDFDLKVCRQPWNSTTVVCTPEVTLQNPEPGGLASLFVDAASISVGASSGDYYYAEFAGGIINVGGWTDTTMPFYSMPGFLDVTTDNDPQVLALSVRYDPSAPQFPSQSRRTRGVARKYYGPESVGIAVEADSIYGFASAALPTTFLDFYVAPPTTAPRIDYQGRLCRESFTGATVACGADGTASFTTFDVMGSVFASAIGVTSPTNSAWDYYFAELDVAFGPESGGVGTFYPRRPDGVSVLHRQ